MLVVVSFVHFCAIVQPIVSCGHLRLQDYLFVCGIDVTYIVRGVAFCGSFASVIEEGIQRVVKVARCSHKPAEFCCGDLNSIHSSATEFFVRCWTSHLKQTFVRRLFTTWEVNGSCS